MTVHLSMEERKRLTGLVVLLVDAQGIRRAREILKDDGLLKSQGPGTPSFKQLIPDAKAVADLIADRLSESPRHHGAMNALADLARESWKTPSLTDRAKQTFRAALAGLESGNWDRYEREIGRLADIVSEDDHPLLEEREAVLALASRKPDRMLHALQSYRTVQEVPRASAVVTTDRIAQHPASESSVPTAPRAADTRPAASTSGTNNSKSGEVQCPYCSYRVSGKSSDALHRLLQHHTFAEHPESSTPKPMNLANAPVPPAGRVSEDSLHKRAGRSPAANLPAPSQPAAGRLGSDGAAQPISAISVVRSAAESQASPTAPVGKKRIFELAKELGLQTSVVEQACRQLGIPAPQRHLTHLSREEVARISAELVRTGLKRDRATLPPGNLAGEAVRSVSEFNANSPQSVGSEVTSAAPSIVAASESPRPVAPVANLGSPSLASLGIWLERIQLLSQQAAERALTSAELIATWEPSLRDAYVRVSSAASPDELTAALTELARLSTSVRDEVRKAVDDADTKRSEAASRLALHLGDFAVDALIKMVADLDRDATQFAVAEIVHAALTEVEKVGFAKSVVLAIERVSFRKQELERECRIRELHAELALLTQLSAPAPLVPITESASADARTADDRSVTRSEVVSIRTARGTMLRDFPPSGGYLHNQLSGRISHSACFLPLDAIGGAQVPQVQDEFSALNGAAAWITQTVVATLVHRGRSISLDAAALIFGDIAALGQAVDHPQDLDPILLLTVVGLALSGSGIPEARRRKEGVYLGGSRTIQEITERAVEVLSLVQDDALLAYLLPKTARLGFVENLLRLGITIDARSRSLGRAWFDAFGLAVAIAPRRSRDSAWERICGTARLREDERQRVENWLEGQVKRPRKKPSSIPDNSGPTWFNDFASRLGQCDYESDSTGDASLGLQVAKVARQEGIWVPPGQSWVRIPLLASNAGRQAAAGIELTIGAATKGVTLADAGGRLHIPWLGANRVGQAWESLLEILVEFGSESIPPEVEFKWVASLQLEGQPAPKSVGGSFKTSTANNAPVRREIEAPPECVNGQPLDLHDTAVLDRSASTVRDCFTSLLSDLRGGRPVRALVYGRRRRGKSSICRSLEQDHDVRMHYVLKTSTWNSSRMTSMRTALEHLAELLVDALAERDIAIEPLKLPETGSRDTLFPAWQAWLTRVGAAVEAPTKILLLVDEFQRWIAGLEDGRDRRALLNIFRGFNDAALGSRLEVSYILFGLQNLKRFRDESLDFAAAVKSYELRPFSLLEAIRYIQLCLPLDHDERVRRRLHALSGGNPFVLNLLCQSLIRSVNADERSWCAPTDVDALMESLDERIEVVFRYMLRQDEEEEAPSLTQLTVLRAVAARLCEIRDPNGWVENAEIEEWLRRKQVRFDDGLVSEQLLQLEESGILARHSDGRRYGVPGEAICRWLASRDEAVAPLQPVTRQADVSLVLNRYRQLKEIGTGGQATAWLAENVEEGGRKVVLKIYPGVGEDVRLRIEREGQALSRIESLYVVQCLGYRVDERKGGVVVLEWVNGLRLDRLLDERPAGAVRILPGADLADQVDLLTKLAEAVHAVHRAGVIHKDLKPANIILIEEGGVWRPKIIDFGIAAPDHGEDVNAVTQSFWTWRYLAPEKRRDPRAPRRRPADIFSLGLVFLDVLMGRREEEPTTLLTSSTLTSKMRLLLSDMLADEPALRPTAEQVVGRLASVLEPEGWKELKKSAERAYTDLLQPDSALEYYRRAVAEATKADQVTPEFGKMLADLLVCAADARERITWWQMLTSASIEAREHVAPAYWQELVARALAADRECTGPRVAFSGLLDSLRNGRVSWNSWCSPLKNRTRLSEIGQTHDGYEECDGRGHRACEAWAA